MSYEIVIQRAKAIEMELGTLGATGRGLHEKLTSIEKSIPVTVAKKIRFVASIRNKIVHADVKPEGDTLTSFASACDDIDGYFQETRASKEAAEVAARRATSEKQARARSDSSEGTGEKGGFWKTGLAVVGAFAAWVWWIS